MKQILLYSIIAALAIAVSTSAYFVVQKNAVIAQHERTIDAQRKLILQLAQQEAIAIHITNEFRSNAVLGKVVVDANIKNVADQVASILKAELNGCETPLKPNLNGH